MSIADRTMQTTWVGPLASGEGTLSEGSSAALDGLQVTWASRTEQPGGKTSPEELAAAAHSSCFAMALALKLGENNTPPQRLDVQSTVTLDAVDEVPQHREMWRTMGALTDLIVDRPDCEQLRDTCNRLLRQLEQHNSKEEVIIYPHADTELPAQVSADLARFIETGRIPDGWFASRLVGEARPLQEWKQAFRALSGLHALSD